MKNGKSKSEVLMGLWRRNAVVGAIVLFVCVAVYLNWNYEQEAGKTLGQAELVGAQTADPLLEGTTTTPTTQEEGTEGTATETETAATTSNSDYFATAKLNRQQARDTALTLLQDAVSGDNANETMQAEANAAIQTMADYTVTEAQIENLVVAKGYTDCVAFIGEQSLSLAVAQPEGGITAQDTAKIVDVVMQATDFTAAQIKIIEVE